MQSFNDLMTQLRVDPKFRQEWNEMDEIERQTLIRNAAWYDLWDERQRNRREPYPCDGFDFITLGDEDAWHKETDDIKRRAGIKEE